MLKKAQPVGRRRADEPEERKDPDMSSSIKRPFGENEVADYERRRYRGLDQKIVHGREIVILRRLLLHIERVTPLQRSGYALDAPCGYGRFSGLLLERGYRLVSSDLSPAMVKRARVKDTVSDFPVGVAADLTRGLPFRANAFSVILSLRFFHHLHDASVRRRILEEFAHASSSWLILSYYRANRLHLLQRRMRRAVKPSQTHIKMISRETFESDVRAAGFEIVKIIPLFRGIHAHHLALLRKAGTGT
jgi:SAM-dependent methyltransferase